MKTSELTGAALDWAVAKCEGFDPETLNTKTGVVYSLRYGVYAPSTNWAQAGPIIEREGIAVYLHGPEKWCAIADDEYRGSTPLIAAMRCYVASKLGDEVEIPKELT
jgi:hypothetical protein